MTAQSQSTVMPPYHHHQTYRLFNSSTNNNDDHHSVRATPSISNFLGSKVPTSIAGAGTQSSDTLSSSLPAATVADSSTATLQTGLHSHRSTITPQEESLAILLPMERPAVPREASIAWNPSVGAPRFMLATSTSQQASSVATRATSASKMPAPKTYTFVAQEPNKPASAESLTTIRQVAMKNYLLSEGGDFRPKRKRLGLHTADDPETSERQSKRQSPSNSSENTPDTTVSGRNSSSPPQEASDENNQAIVWTRLPVDNLATEERYRGIVMKNHPTVLYSQYMSNGTGTIYFAHRREEFDITRNFLNKRMDPFAVWPPFPRKDAEVEKLKITCTSRFATPGLARVWAPALLRSSNAFYSTVCLSSAHDDILDNENNLTGSKWQESASRQRFRIEINQMINWSLQQKDYSDDTIIAVLHVFYSELIGGRLEEINAHQKGLDGLVHERNGLANLGVQGHLAKTLVIIMYLSGCMFESSPDYMYMRHALSIQTEPPRTSTDYLNAPIYAAKQFVAMLEPQPTETLLGLLELTRQAAGAFQLIHSTPVQSPARLEEARATLSKCHRALFKSQTPQGQRSEELGQYQMVKLSCCVFVHALVSKLPLSQAAQNLSLQTSGVGQGNGVQSKSSMLLLQLKAALKQSSYSDCWGNRSNLLLWCGLIALAVANGQYHDDQQLQQARDFIAAATLRTAIMQVFGHPLPMLGMLKRFNAIQEVLAAGRIPLDTFRKALPQSNDIMDGSGHIAYTIGEPRTRQDVVSSNSTSWIGF